MTAELYWPIKASVDAVSVNVKIVSPQGGVVREAALLMPIWTAAKELLAFELNGPSLWSPEDPQLYTCEVQITAHADVSSSAHRFGIRHTRFEEHGPFYLNGERLAIRGTHLHEDHAGYAAAVPDAIVWQELTLIKQMGANFVRLGHYQQSRLTLNLCDELGLLVWEEVPWCRSGVGTTLWRERGLTQLRNMIEQHRNHPSIILWGLGNEDDWPGEIEGDDHAAIRAYMTELRDLAHQLDPTRLTSYRRCDFAHDIPDVYSPSIWSGWYGGNYRDYGAALDKARAATPRLMHVEFGADSHAGRHAEVLPELSGKSTHAANIETWSETYACDLFDWYLKTQAERPWLTGAVQWAFKDFTTPLRVGNPVPRVNQKGLTTRDLKLKEAYFVFQSWWATAPMLHIYGHDWPVRWGAAGEDRLVRVYSNCAEVELFWNGRSLGRRKRDPNNFPCAGLRWNVKFAAGENRLRAEAVHKGVTLRDSIGFTYQTAQWGKPSVMRLALKAPEFGSIWVEATVHDAAGVRCLDAAMFVRFSVSGLARMNDNLGTPTGSRVVQMYNGRAALSLAATGKAVTAVSADGIEPAFLTLPFTPTNPAAPGDKSR